MPKIWLVFKDEKGAENRVEVDRTPFTVGRHSTCDLTIVDSRLSREHLRIEWQTDRFVASDPGSSNGTTLNGEKLTDPAGLANESILDLGGVEIQVVLEGAEPEKPAGAAPPPVDVDEPSADIAAPSAAADSGAVPTVQAATPASGGGVPTALFIIAPLLGVFVLIAVIGAVVFLGGGDRRAAGPNNGQYEDPTDEPVLQDDDDTPIPRDTATPTPTATPVTNGPGPVSTPISGTVDTPPPSDTSETAKVERNGAAFVRQIAQNDPRAFLTGDQAARVSAKVKQLGRSSALADNINSARKNANAIKTLAAQKNLKPQFLAVAAITKLGSSRGDVLQSAQSVAEVYDQLRIQIGNENFDDALLMVAAYDQGAAGDTMKLRNMLQDLATKSSEGTRTIRSIWFLEKAGKITAAEYERALNFLAIGTIAQNPKEFGVNAEALTL